MCDISVIIPLYNGKNYIRRCVESLINQNFDSYEIIVVDDGSTDDGVDVIKDFLKEPYIRVIKKENEGTAQARKTGLDTASGKFVQFVDADDWFENDMLSKMYASIIMQNADFVCCGAIIEDGKGKQIGKNTVSENMIIDDVRRAVELLHNDQAIYPVVWNKLIRKELAEKIIFPKGLFLGEDYDMTLQLAENSICIVQIPDALYHYVIHGGNITKCKNSHIYLLSREKHHLIRDRLLRQYHAQKESIISFHLLQDLYCLNGLIRADYDKKSVERLIAKEMKSQYKILMSNESISITNKCAVFFACNSISVYCILYKLFLKIMSYGFIK